MIRDLKEKGARIWSVSSHLPRQHFGKLGLARSAIIEDVGPRSGLLRSVSTCSGPTSGGGQASLFVYLRMPFISPEHCANELASILRGKGDRTADYAVAVPARAL